jgi:hypothetical protein
LIFAGIGASLTLPNAQGVSKPVVGAATFGAIVIMVIITTLVTPPLLKWSLGGAPPLGATCLWNPDDQRKELWTQRNR